MLIANSQEKLFSFHNQQGYIALISTIVISILLVAVTITLGFNGFLGRFNILDSESKERSLALAEACVDKAILRFSQDSSYNPSNECEPVGDSCPANGMNNICTIVSVTSSGGDTFIKTKAILNDSYSYLLVTIDTINFNMSGWQECPNLTSSTGGC